MRLVVYLAGLESIGFEIDGPQLEKTKKEEIARSILAIPKLCRNPSAICMAAELCREFNAWCPTTWQMLLQQLVVLKQVGGTSKLPSDEKSISNSDFSPSVILCFNLYFCFTN